MVSSLWESKLFSLSRSLSLSLRDSCSWCISLSFSSMAANFSSSACCERANRGMSEWNYSHCGEKITQKECAPPEPSPFLSAFAAAWKARRRFPPDFCFARSLWPCSCTPNEHKQKVITRWIIEIYQITDVLTDKKKNITHTEIFYLLFYNLFVYVRCCCVTCSCCSLSARVDVSRWMVTSWACTFLLVWSSSSWYWCSRALSLSPISPLSFLIWLFRSWREKW